MKRRSRGRPSKKSYGRRNKKSTTIRKYGVSRGGIRM